MLKRTEILGTADRGGVGAGAVVCMARTLRVIVHRPMAEGALGQVDLVICCGFAHHKLFRSRTVDDNLIIPTTIRD